MEKRNEIKNETELEKLKRLMNEFNDAENKNLKVKFENLDTFLKFSIVGGFIYVVATILGLLLLLIGLV